MDNEAWYIMMLTNKQKFTRYNTKHKTHSFFRASTLTLRAQPPPNNLNLTTQTTTMVKNNARRRATRRLVRVVKTNSGDSGVRVLPRPSRQTHRDALFKGACAKVSEVLPSLDPGVAGDLEVSASALAALSDFSDYHADFTSCFKEALAILAWVATPRATQARIALLRYAAALSRSL